MSIKTNYKQKRATVNLEALDRAITTPANEIKSTLRFTQEKKEEFLNLLRTKPNYSACAALVGVSSRTIKTHRYKDPEFDAACEEAYEEARYYVRDKVLSRGIEGVEHKIYYQGKECGTETRYSDSLGLAALQSLFPTEFSTRAQVDLKADITVNSSEAKNKLLSLLGIDESEIIEGEFKED